MSQHSLSPNDPKFTAYALGELEPGEHAAVEAALRDNPAARAAVEEIRATAAQLTAALAAEPALDVETPHAPARTRAAAEPHDLYRKRKTGPFGQLLEFPQVYYVVGGLAAACFALMFALREPQPHPPRQSAIAENLGEQKVYTTLNLSALPSALPAAPALAEIPATGTGLARVSLPPSPASALNIPPADAPAVASSPAARAENLGLLAQAKQEGQLITAVATSTSLRESVAPAPSTASAPQSEAVPVLRASLVQPGPAVGGDVALSGNIPLLVETTSGLQPAGPVATGEAKMDAGRANAGAGLTLVTSAISANIPGGDALALTPFQVSSGSAGRMGFAPRESMRFPRVPLPPTVRRNTESYASTNENDFLSAEHNRLSTFSLDVDTAGYSNLRRLIEGGQLPPVDAVRIEEMVNYFSYRYPEPKDDQPLAVALEVASAPWAPAHRLVRIGLKGRAVSTATRPAANLVFLLDVSGSMNAPNRLPLVKESLRVLVDKLRPDDHVAIVTYAGQSGLALASTPVSQAREILAALDALSPGGATNGSMGIQLAYDIAKANFVEGGINRVILCTDGDFNVGVSSEGALTRLIGEKAKSGVFLTVLGFGMGNLKDALLEKLADRGNGNYGYVDSRHEAEKLFAEQVNGTLVTIARDVKIQVEFNPDKVASYRLIGYENRALKKEDFNNDQVDAGELGAGHTMTALYEIVPVGVGGEEKGNGAGPRVDDLKYASQPAARARRVATAEKGEAGSDELLTVKVRYKKPDGILSRRLEVPLVDHGALFANASADFKFAAAVASFGMLLRESTHRGTATLTEVITWAGGAIDDDPHGYRADFITVVAAARRLMISRDSLEK